jgi:anti-anti-sigma regulatory factor
MTTITVQPELASLSPPVWFDQGLTINIDREGDSCVVHVAGALDLATRNQLFLACTSGNHPTMMIDISQLTFMDASGYSGIAAARNVFEAYARTLKVRGGIGQPARLLHLIAELERQARADRANPPST